MNMTSSGEKNKFAALPPVASGYVSNL